MNKFLVALAASAAFATPAFAQDAEVAVAGPSGFRIGMVGGIDRVTVDLTEDAQVVSNLYQMGATLNEVELKAKGLFYGINVGYDIAVSNNTSVGFEGEATFSAADGTDAIVIEDAVSTLTLAAAGEAKRDLYAGARLSYAPSAKFNFYVKGGYTNARLSAAAASLYVEDDFVEEGIVVLSRNLDGFRVGAGAQVNLAKNVYLGLEYRHSSYEDDVSRDQVATSVGFRF